MLNTHGLLCVNVYIINVQLTDLIVRDCFNNIEISLSGSGGLLFLACLNLSCLLYEELYSLPEREHPDEDNVPSGKGK